MATGPLPSHAHLLPCSSSLGGGRLGKRETTGPALLYWSLSSQGHRQTLGHPRRSRKVGRPTGRAETRSRLERAEADRAPVTATRTLHHPGLRSGGQSAIGEKGSWRVNEPGKQRTGREGADPWALAPDGAHLTFTETSATKTSRQSTSTPSVRPQGGSQGAER